MQSSTPISSSTSHYKYTSAPQRSQSPETLQISDVAKWVQTEIQNKNLDRAVEILDLVEFCDYTQEQDVDTIAKTYTFVLETLKSNQREDLIPKTLAIVKTICPNHPAMTEYLKG